jgi:shikimate dehydrogenase
MTRTSKIAKRAGAVNTFHTSESGELIGDNTDVPGFNALVESVLGSQPANARVAILGAGGAARGVLTALESWPNARATLYARNIESAKELAMRFPVVTGVNSMTQAGTIECDFVVNATTVGVSNDDMPLELSRLPRSAAVIDLVYRPRETKWVREASSLGFRASDGLPMLVEQAARSFEIWFRQAPDREVMSQAAKRATGRG